MIPASICNKNYHILQHMLFFVIPLFPLCNISKLPYFIIKLAPLCNKIWKKIIFTKFRSQTILPGYYFKRTELPLSSGNETRGTKWSLLSSNWPMALIDSQWLWIASHHFFFFILKHFFNSRQGNWIQLKK